MDMVKRFVRSIVACALLAAPLHVTTQSVEPDSSNEQNKQTETDTKPEETQGGKQSETSTKDASPEESDNNTPAKRVPYKRVPLKDRVNPNQNVNLPQDI